MTCHIRGRNPLELDGSRDSGISLPSHKDRFMSLQRLSSAAAIVAAASSAFATITPGELFGDSYIVKAGAGASARFYSVLDVYIKGNNAADIISSTFGVSGYPSAYTMNQGDAFVQSNGDGSNNSWKPAASTTAWDSFVTCGARTQTEALFLNIQLDTNWAPGNGSAINGVNGGAGWYPAIGASTSTNPYARIGYYNNGDTSAINTAKATTDIAGNGIVAGQNLNNHWMIGRFTIEVTGLEDTAVKTMSLKFAIAGKQNGTTTFTGSTSAAGRFNYTLAFAVPAPGAVALAGLAGLIGRRRR
jgi:MYXO-CTERM domain-containing protein